MTDKHSSLFSKVMATKSSNELKEISLDEENYTNDARMAALQELQNRDGISDEHSKVESEILADEGRIKENREDFLESTKPPEGLPKIITKTVNILYITLIISAIATIYVNFIVGVVTGYETVVENGEVVTVTYTGFFPILLLIGFYGIYFLFIQQIGLGKNWARITMLVLFFISALFTIIGLPNSLLSDPFSGVLSLVWFIVSSIAYVLLFTGESARWFSSKKYDSDLLDD